MLVNKKIFEFEKKMIPHVTLTYKHNSSLPVFGICDGLKTSNISQKMRFSLTFCFFFKSNYSFCK